MTAVDHHEATETEFRRGFLLASAGVGIVAAVVLVNYPEIDLWVSGALRSLCADGSSAGWCRGHAVLAVRTFFITVFWLACFASVFALAVAVARKCTVLGACRLRWMLMTAALIVGPGLVANLVFKDHWGRARPRDVVEFGGGRQFSPALLPTDQCQRNCSFVSGEASSMFAIAFAAAMVWPQVRVPVLAGGLVAGLAAGLIRMSQGAHFLSDIVFAGVFMALTVSAVHILLFGVWRHVDYDTLMRRLQRRFVEPVAAGLGLSLPTPASERMPWGMPGLD